MSGHLILSLDFELMWGVRDHRSVADYGDAVLGVRQALPAMLSRFGQNRIRATWAAVGLIFARNRDEMLDYAPALRPAYRNADLSPYSYLAERVGMDENADPLHFGRSLLDQVASVDGQEIGSHTFSHFYCLEDGQTLDAFKADLTAGCAIAASAGHVVSSIVFPRNQMTPDHIRAAADLGITRYRGNPGGFAYRSRSNHENTLPVRGLRLLDSVMPVAGRVDFPTPQPRHDRIDVPASRFLRPWSRRAPQFSRLHLDHVQREMTRAARDGRCYHLWWHPHNMGRNIEANLAQLDAVLSTFVELRDRFGMTSSNMSDMTRTLRHAA